jgi:hypothetical protein
MFELSEKETQFLRVSFHLFSRLGRQIDHIKIKLQSWWVLYSSAAASVLLALLRNHQPVVQSQFLELYVRRVLRRRLLKKDPGRSPREDKR